MDEVAEYGCVSASIAEHADGSGFALIFQCGIDEPDEQDVALGMDSYCLITADQGTDYGGVIEATLRERVLRLVLAPDALAPLEVSDTEIEATLEAGDEVIEEFRAGLRRILTYGRPGARPQILRL
ncbi:MAG TPA: Imm10 family immunity protein [Pseudonocardiaceae bacterium]|jgi:hypothetical protein|nr:Imm10 family immunity protein [Pseudonocardiaceae bacterium]